jgi:hypothetical protein
LWMASKLSKKYVGPKLSLHKRSLMKLSAGQLSQI